MGWVGRDQFLLMEVFKEGFKRINFPTDTFGGVVFKIQSVDVGLKVLCLDGGSLGNSFGFQMNPELFQVTVIGNSGRRRPPLTSKIGDELFEGG